jgi:sugar lactone lactonase YvrE
MGYRGRAGRCLTLTGLALALAACTAPVSRATQPVTTPVVAAPPATSPAAPAAPGPRVVTRLDRPGALTVGPDGQLYIADDGLNEILRLLPDGEFEVIAGNGTAGFSGDGGPAVDASLNDPGGMAVTRSGTLYVADTGNNRIRAVSPSGIITTIAGTGRSGGWVTSGTTALRASLLSPGDVAIGPGQTLYITNDGASQILKLTPSRQLVLAAGLPGQEGMPRAGQPATKTAADGPDGLAFDGAGDLFAAGADTKTLFMIAPDGRVSLPIGAEGFYPRGRGGLVAAPGGSVLAMNQQQIDRLTGHGLEVLYDLAARPLVDIEGFLPGGIAVAPDGTLYLDTWNGNGYASETALIEVSPAGKARVIWQS